jgi:hypothetical protein
VNWSGCLYLFLGEAGLFRVRAIVSSRKLSKEQILMIAKIVAAVMIALSLFATTPTAKAGAPFPHCYPCGVNK